MENLIEVINRIQEAYNKVNETFVLDLPRIAVVGAQSCGKSSVLEAIVGADFLPRGSGIVTRCPLNLQLHHIMNGEPYAIFDHLKHVTFTDFSKIRDEIARRTDELAGTNKCVSAKSIILKVYSPSVPNLTLIDLPGLTNNPIEGQPKEIVKTIKALVTEFAKEENTLILALSPANMDLATSDSLKLARQLDPENDRTIGVITKLDMMDSGTDAMDALNGKLYPLKLGYIGVVCRSQKDIDRNKSLKDSLASEEKFFSDHPVYSKIKNRCGIPYLAHTLSKLLIDRIQSCLPGLRANITALLQAKKDEMKTYGFDLIEESENPKDLLLFMITKFTEYYHSMIDGRFIKNSTTKLQGGARIHYIFHTLYTNAINNIKALDGLSDEYIRIVLINSKSLHPSLFIPDKAFEILVRQQSVKLLAPSTDCMKLVHKELEQIVIQPDVPELSRFNNLKSRISELMIELLNKCIGSTEEIIKNLIESEKWYANMEHPDMIPVIKKTVGLMDYSKPDNNADVQKAIQEQQRKEEEARKKKEEQEKQKNNKKGGGGVFGFFRFGGNKKKEDEDEKEEEKSGASSLQRKNAFNASMPEKFRINSAPTNREIMEASTLKNLIEGYFGIIKKNIVDLVPKTIVTFLINKSKSLAQTELVKSLYLEKDVAYLMTEDTTFTAKRKDCHNAIEAFEEAIKVLNEINLGGT